MITTFALLLVFVPMVWESRVSARHERALRAAGAVEPSGDVYRWMLMAYPAAFLLMIAEGALRQAPPGRWTWAGAAVFGGAKLLKYWAMSTLGPRWTFRVLVPPRSGLVSAGPYRWLRHPNYLAVAGELSGVALAMHAVVTALPVVAGFALLMGRRVRIEERALGVRPQ